MFIRRRIILCLLIFGFSVIAEQYSVAQTIIDQSGTSHTYIGKSAFHEKKDAEIYLHQWLSFKGDQINYWHAKIIHAGYNLGSNGFPQHGLDSYNDGGTSVWYSSHDDYKLNNANKDLSWYKGFFICDGHQNPCGNNGDCWEADGDADLTNLSAWPRYPENPNSGAVIFRADSFIVLSDGFRVSYNPGAAAHNISPHTITHIDGSSNSDLVKITCPNHHFPEGATVLLRDISGNSDLAGSLSSAQFRIHLIYNTDGSLNQSEKDHFLIRDKFGDGTAISGTSVGTAQLWHNIPDNAYFHGYTGDRFSNCSDLWENAPAINADFTLSSTTIATDLNPNSNSKFEVMDICHPKRPETGDYNSDPVNNVVLNATIPETNDKALDLIYTPNSLTCSTSNRSATRSLAGITTGRIEHNVNTPLCSLLCAAVEVTAKFPSVRPHAPAIWSYHNIDDGSSTGDDFAGSDEIDAADCNGYWFAENWDPSTPWSEGEDEVYQYGAGTVAKLQYASHTIAYGNTRYDLMGSRYFLVNFTQIPYNTTNSSFSANFHTYSYEWLPGEVRFLLGDANGNNKVEVGRTTRFVPEHPMNVLVTNQWGPDNAPYSHMYVSSVKAKRFNENNSCGVAAIKQTVHNQPSSNDRSALRDFEIQSISPNPAQDNVSVQIKYLTKN
ncbi:MAG TPA: hypothetical protein VIX80_00630, partial [Candidatus Kapabacteria bacterium]